MQLFDTLWFSCQKSFSLPTKLMGWVMDLCKFIAVCGMSSYLRFIKDAKHFLLHFLTTWPKLRMKLLSILTLLWLFVVWGSLLWPKNATHEDGSKVGQRRSLLNRENSWQLKTDITKVILLWMILKGKGHHVFLQIFHLFFEQCKWWCEAESGIQITIKYSSTISHSQKYFTFLWGG